MNKLKPPPSVHPHPGDGSLHPRVRSRDPQEGSHRGDLSAARRLCEPGGAEEGPEGEGHQGGGPLKVPGRGHHLPPAAQRAVCDWWTTGEGLFLSCSCCLNVLCQGLYDDSDDSAV